MEKLRSSLVCIELTEKAVRKMGAGEKEFGGRKAGPGRFGRVVHRMHSGCTEGKSEKKSPEHWKCAPGLKLDGD